MKKMELMELIKRYEEICEEDVEFEKIPTKRKDEIYEAAISAKTSLKIDREITGDASPIFIDEIHELLCEEKEFRISRNYLNRILEGRPIRFNEI